MGASSSFDITLGSASHHSRAFDRLFTAAGKGKAEHTRGREQDTLASRRQRQRILRHGGWVLATRYSSHVVALVTRFQSVGRRLARSSLVG